LGPGSSSPQTRSEPLTADPRHPTGDEVTAAHDPELVHEVLDVMADLGKVDVR